MERKPLPKSKQLKKQRSMKSIEKELWELCRQITFKRYADRDGNVYCYTTGRGPLEGANRQCGHAYPKGALGASMKYDLRILRPQSYYANINLGGMGAEFWARLTKEIGQDKADELLKDCQRSKAHPINSRDHYLYLVGLYKPILEALQ